MTKDSIYTTLSIIQQSLSVPKGQKNSFGGYKYRSCEDIFEAVKKVLPEGCTLTATDSMMMLGDRFYIEAVVMLRNKSGEAICSMGYAREAEHKKGMDDSQITGTASSYARKYAANGLLLIDDTKDADTDEFTKKTLGSKTKTTPKAKGGNPDLGSKELISLLGKCKTIEDSNKFRLDYKEVISGLPDVEEKKVKTKFKSVRKTLKEKDND